MNVKVTRFQVFELLVLTFVDLLAYIGRLYHQWRGGAGSWGEEVAHGAHVVEDQHLYSVTRNRLQIQNSRPKAQQ